MNSLQGPVMVQSSALEVGSLAKAVLRILDSVSPVQAQAQAAQVPQAAQAQAPLAMGQASVPSPAAGLPRQDSPLRAATSPGQPSLAADPPLQAEFHTHHPASTRPAKATANPRTSRVKGILHSRVFHLEVAALSRPDSSPALKAVTLDLSTSRRASVAKASPVR